jgi:hypothetical protein
VLNKNGVDAGVGEPALSEEKNRNREMKNKPENNITPGAKLNGTRKWGRFYGHEC